MAGRRAESDVETQASTSGRSLRIQGESAAGKPVRDGAGAGRGRARLHRRRRCRPGADRVVIQEEAVRDGERVTPRRPPPARSRHIRVKRRRLPRGRGAPGPSGARHGRLAADRSPRPPAHGEVAGRAASAHRDPLDGGGARRAAAREAEPHQIFESNGVALAARARSAGVRGSEPAAARPVTTKRRSPRR